MGNKKDGDYKLLSDKKLSRDRDFFIVGIGASAGGLEALESFFGNVPTRSPLAFVVILHLSPDYKSLMAQLLSKHTQMQVNTAENGTTILPNNVYLIPPKKTITIRDRTLFLHEKNENKAPTFTIDIFFKSLAEEENDRAIGVILSGTGSDGTQGMKAIKETGGMLMVQDPSSAKFDGMPRNAINTGIIDYVLSPEKMPGELIHFIQHPTIQLEITKGNSSGEDSLHKTLTTIKKATDIDFSLYKRETILRRIQRRININKFRDIEEYANYLSSDPQETRILQKELLIGVTKFFRGENAFKFLETNVIPEIFKQAKNNSVRVWSVGCSTGEEAYSLAILLHEHAQTLDETFDIKIFATDVDQEAISKASIGRYPENIVNDISVERLHKYFVRQGEEYQPTRTLRDIIIFTRHDIIKDAPFNKLDLVCCRNLLIYFQTPLQRKVFQILNFALHQNGFLFLGSSESADDMKGLFISVNAKYKVYRSILNTKLINIGDYNLSRLQTHPTTSPEDNRLSGIYSRYDKGKELDVIADILSAQFTKVSILIHEDYSFIRYFGDARKYLFLPQRLDNVSILAMINEKLSIPLSTAIKRALETQKSVQYRDLFINDNEAVHLSVTPKKIENLNRTYLLITLVESSTKPEDKGEIIVYDVEKTARQRINDLENELKSTRENLQATIEELQTSNEELIAANEELQSTNEELQSVNEELYTINSEHQANILELTELNDDVNNLLQSTEIGTLFLDEKMRIRKFNKSITEQISIAESDIGRPIEHFATKLIYPRLLKDVKQVLDTLIPFQKEVQDKNDNWFLMRILPYRTSENQIKGVVITFVSINELKEAGQLRVLTEQLKNEVNQHKDTQQKLKEQNEAFSLLFSALPDLYLRMDSTGVIIDAMVGPNGPKVKPERLINNNVSSILPPNQIGISMEVIRNIQKSGKPRTIDYKVENSLGSQIYEARLMPAYEGEVVAVIRDITHDNALRQELYNQGRELSLLFETVPDLFFRIDKNGNFISSKIGEGFEALIPDRPLENMNIIHAFPLDYADTVFNAIQVSIESQETGIVTVSAIGKDAESRLYECRIMPLTNNEATCIIRDVTELRARENRLIQLADELRDQKEQLATSNKALEQFAYITSHDLKEPIRSISSFSQLLERKFKEHLEGDKDAREYFSYIKNSTNRMYALVEGILEYSRIGRKDYSLNTILSRKCVEDAIQNLSKQIETENAKVKIGKMPRVFGNGSLLTQLFQNLISNALKFRQIDQDPIIEISSTSYKKDFIKFTVKDNGKGFNMNYKELIFEMFKQLDASEKFKGTGIGLAVCKRIVEQHNGKIWVESEPYIGTSFYFTIPIKALVD